MSEDGVLDWLISRNRKTNHLAHVWYQLSYAAANEVLSVYLRLHWPSTWIHLDLLISEQKTCKSWVFLHFLISFKRSLTRLNVFVIAAYELFIGYTFKRCNANCFTFLIETTVCLQIPEGQRNDRGYWRIKLRACFWEGMWKEISSSFILLPQNKG